MHEPTVASIQEVVTTCALDWPVLAKILFGLEYLLTNDPRVGRSLPQTREVLQWVAQAIGMIDTNSIENTFAKPIEYAAVCLLKDVWPFNPKSDKSVHIEKTAIAKFLIGCSPVRQSVVLEIQQFIQGIMI
jgi:hypothetical protein